MALTPSQRETARKLFDAALDCRTEIRSGFIQNTCEDPDVRQEVNRLLAHHAEIGSFLKEPGSSELSSAANVPAFSEGDILASRFSITRLIAHGGMGEVYEAEDLELREPVAVKTIRSDLVRPPFLDQFKKEVQLAKRVTHQNVCRIYDLFRHTVAHSGAEDIYFVSMELLSGETLAEHLRGRSRMTPAEALPIIEQIAGALEAAHAIGILHRDLKPENIMLIHSGPRGSIRAVVMDFGLAVKSHEDVPIALESPAGTPAYMSPEQLQGNTLTAASDVYCLGLVIYRMVTGVRAFEENEPTLFGLKRLTKRPRPARELAASLPLFWETAIGKCLEREPTRRPQSATELVRDLRGKQAYPRPTFNNYKRITSIASAVGFVFLLLFALIVVRRTLTPPMAPKSHPRVAVLGFKNVSGQRDADWISTALAIFLTAKLSAGDKLDAIGEDEIARMRTDLALSDSNRLSKDALVRIRSMVNADLVIAGSYRENNRRVHFELRVLDATTGAVVESIHEVGTPGALFDAFNKVGIRVRSTLKLPATVQHDEEEAIASLPSNLEAFRFYTTGIDKLEQFDALDAGEQLSQAIKLEPAYPLAHSALAEACSALGYEEKAANEAKTAFDLSGRLSWRDRLLIEGRYREMTKQWSLASDIYRRLWAAYPDAIDYGLHLASVQSSAGTPTEALATVERLRKLPRPARDDPRIDYAEAWAWDGKRKLVAAQTAARKAAASGQRQLYAAAKRDEGRSLIFLGNREGAINALKDAKAVYAALGDRAHVAYVTLNLATAFYGQASLSSRKAMIFDALAIFRSVGSKDGEASALNNLAGVLEDAGDLDTALKTYREALDAFNRTGNRSRLANTQNNIGTVLEVQGDLAGALKEFRASLAAWTALNDTIDMALAQENIADVLYLTGKLPGAAKMTDELFTFWQRLDNPSHVAGALQAKAAVLAAQGHIARAKDNYQKALSILRRIGEAQSLPRLLNDLTILVICEGNLAQARDWINQARESEININENDLNATTQAVSALLLLEEGKPGEAEETARQAVRQLFKHHFVMNEAFGELVLTQSLLAQLKLSDAQRELSKLAFLRTTQNQLMRFSYLIAETRIKAASGQQSEISAALRTLRMTLAESEAQGFAGLNLEARLAQDEIQLKLGDPNARDHLLSLQMDATNKGFGLIAQKASRLALNTKL